MIPQGSVVFSAARINSLTARIEAVQAGIDLQPLVDEAMQSLLAVKSAITSELALLAPILALLTAPTNPTAVITWITNYITSVLTPQYLPYIHYVEQLTEMTTAVTGLVSAIEDKAMHLDITVTIPTF